MDKQKLEAAMKKRLETTILINAPIMKVWKTLSDFSEYKSWNNSLLIHDQISASNIRVGDYIQLSIQPKAAKPATARVLLLEKEELKRLTWQGKLFGLPGVLIGHHCFELQPMSEEKTLVLHYEDFSGILVPFVWGSYLNKILKEVFISFNEAAKKKCEA